MLSGILNESREHGDLDNNRYPLLNKMRRWHWVTVGIQEDLTLGDGEIQTCYLPCELRFRPTQQTAVSSFTVCYPSIHYLSLYPERVAAGTNPSWDWARDKQQFTLTFPPMVNQEPWCCEAPPCRSESVYIFKKIQKFSNKFCVKPMNADMWLLSTIQEWT